MSKKIRSLIRTIPNHPKEGILFRDVTTLLKHPEGFKETIDVLSNRYSEIHVDVVAGVEARGFIIGSALAYALGKGFVPLRKKGKLPGKTIRQEYALEYGTDTIELHEDALKKGDKVLLVDDLLATGGTCFGAIALIEKLGGHVEEICFVVDLPELGGGKKLKEKGYRYFAITEFEGH